MSTSARPPRANPAPAAHDLFGAEYDEPDAGFPDQPDRPTVTTKGEHRVREAAAPYSVEAILAAPDASYWLKAAVRALVGRDPVDAANDADVLAEIIRRRAAAVLGAGTGTPTNAERAGCGRDALAYFARLVGQEEEPDHINITDLLADLMHLHGPEDVRGAVEMAETHYNAETDEEAE